MRSSGSVSKSADSLITDSIPGSTIWEMIIFDWDGTAVKDRHAAIGDLKAALEELLKEGGLCAIVTGTNLENILKQGIADLSPLAKQGLHICTNRGSEVFDFDSLGNPQLIFRRQATQSENRALDRAAIEVHDWIKSEGMQTEIIFDRLNRRKVDLIPEPKWSSPKKAQFRELLTAVEARMQAAKLKGGITELIQVAENITKNAGLPHPKITSDIKHIEIGLTDKGDSATWIAKSIIRPDKIPLSKVSVWGDELGSLGKLPGSDALMRTPELRDASFFSVGIEPEGVPSWVHALGGGPRLFIQFLFHQASLRRELRKASDLEISPAPSKDRSWILEQDGFDPSRERVMESLFAISNGNLGVRGASDLPIPAAQADLFVAGIYDQRVPSQPYSETELFAEGDPAQSMETEIVPLPFPFRFLVQLDEEPIYAGNVIRTQYRRCLDFQKGVYFEHNLIESAKGQKTDISSFRICSHFDPHLLIQRIKLTSENYSGHFDIDLSLYPHESPEVFAELYPHIRMVPLPPLGEPLGKAEACRPQISEIQLFQTSGSKEFIALASRIIVHGRELKAPRFSTDLSPGEILTIERRVSVFCSPKGQQTDQTESFPESVGEARKVYDSALKHSKSQQVSLAPSMIHHFESWKRFWAVADLDLPQAQGPTDALRFNLYHLQSSAVLSPETSIPAKALTGRAYEGHIFWDTEIFILPFFIYTAPEIARQLLLYRFNTLTGARKRASKMGFHGACFAWESTETGEDETPHSISISGKASTIPIFTGPQELHITADIAWAIFKYWDGTLDEVFMRDYGVEILIETARFWVSRVVLSENQYHLKGVVGPDEYHYGVNDNAFTNWMVRFNLEVAIRMTEWLSKEHSLKSTELSSKLSLGPDEIVKWREVFNRLYVPEPGENGVIEQFEGFFALKSVELSPADKTRAPISRLFGWEQINQTRIVKQADVLMIPFLFPEKLPLHVIQANYNYYNPITDHGSSLSPCVHAAIAARTGKMDDALRYWKESLYFDLHNTMSNSQLGIHAAALGGTWQALVFHLLGVRPSETAVGPGFKPGFIIDEKASSLIPPEWNGLKMILKYRNHTYTLILKSGPNFKTTIESTQEAA